MKISKTQVGLLVSLLLNVLQTLGIVPQASAPEPAPGTVQLPPK